MQPNATGTQLPHSPGSERRSQETAGVTTTMMPVNRVCSMRFTATMSVRRSVVALRMQLSPMRQALMSAPEVRCASRRRAGVSNFREGFCSFAPYGVLQKRNPS